MRQRLERLADDWPDACARRASLRRERVAWTVAAAGVVLALLGWWPALVEGLQGMPEPDALQRAAVAARADLLASVPDVGHWHWAGDLGLAVHAKGDVVWDNAGQRGFLRLSDLPPTEPGRTQYQLWVFDATRDDRYPVDGGVFDLPHSASPVVIPIHTRLRISRPEAFAVTLEATGGVVVSDRQRVVAVARVGDAG